MNRTSHLIGAAAALAALVAALVIVLGRPSPTASTPPAALGSAAVTSTAATDTTAGTTGNRAVPGASTVPAPTVTVPPTGRVNSSMPTAAPGRPRAAVPRLTADRQTDPLAVAETAVATLYTVDPAADGDPAAASRRTGYLLTPTLAAALTAPSGTGSGARWRQWAQDRAYVTVSTGKIDIPWTVADNRYTVVRTVGFRQTVHTPTTRTGSTGSTGSTTAGTASTAGTAEVILPQQTLAVTLVRAADDRPWRVDHLETP